MIVAECADDPYPDDWTDDGVEAENYANRARAKAVCGTCPLQAACLRWALESNAEGVWGGTTTAERTRIRNRSRKAAML